MATEWEGVVRTAIEPYAEALAADGYTLEIAHAGDETVELVVHASEDACANCLSPKSVLREAVRAALEKRGLEIALVNIEVQYPPVEELPGGLTR